MQLIHEPIRPIGIHQAGNPTNPYFDMVNEVLNWDIDGTQNINPQNTDSDASLTAKPENVNTTFRIQVCLEYPESCPTVEESNNEGLIFVEGDLYYLDSSTNKIIQIELGQAIADKNSWADFSFNWHNTLPPKFIGVFTTSASKTECIPFIVEIPNNEDDQTVVGAIPCFQPDDLTKHLFLPSIDR